MCEIMETIAIFLSLCCRDRQEKKRDVLQSKKEDEPAIYFPLYIEVKHSLPITSTLGCHTHKAFGPSRSWLPKKLNKAMRREALRRLPSGSGSIICGIRSCKREEVVELGETAWSTSIYTMQLGSATDVATRRRV